MLTPPTKIFVITLGLASCAGRRAPHSIATLKQAAAPHGKLVGTAVDVDLLRHDERYARVLEREFSVVSPQNEMKFGWVNKVKEKYNFSDADFLCDFARRHDMKVRGHTLAWHRNLPKWLTDAKLAGAPLARVLTNHVREVVSHFRARYADQIVSWDVVNEALLRDGKPRLESIWTKIGPAPLDFVSLAFRAARAADPTTPLFYNDFSTEEINDKSNAVYDLLRTLRAKGVPIDGVGFQMHLAEKDPVNAESVRENFARFAKLGLKIHITEFDYQMSQTPPPDARRLGLEAETYRSMAKICAAEPACEMFVSWGFTDAHSWIPEFFAGYGSALYFDEDYRPKPAYFSLREALE